MAKLGATFVPPRGELDSPFILVGEQPGRMEVKLREPFSGPASKVLLECLNAANITSYECYKTNVIKNLDHKLFEIFRYDRGKARVTSEYYEHLEVLKEELAKTTGLLIAIGNVALYALTGNLGITKWRGSVLDCTLLPGRKVLPIIHPMTVLPPKMVYKNKLLIQMDLQRARQVVDGKFQASDYHIAIQPSFMEAMDYLEECYQEGMKGYTIDYDIELRFEEMSCIAFTYNSWAAMSIPFVHGGGDYFTVDQEVEILKAIAKILEEPKIKKRGQNLIFDSHFLIRKHGIVTKNIDDTMVAQQVAMGEYPRGLDFITSIWTTHPYYKDDGKAYFEGGNWPKLWTYNGTDSMVTAEAFPKQWEMLRNQLNIETYRRQVKLIEPLAYMMERGILVDLPGVIKTAGELDVEIEDLTRQLHAIAGFELNPNSSKQLIQHFYGTQGYRPYKSKTTKNITVDADALKRLTIKGSKEAAIILEIRKKSKIRSVYLEPLKFDKDHRVRCSYNPVGTRYSRLSSSENIFGTGMNMQNIPHSVHKYFKADEGYIFCSFDLAQAENRIVAYLGQIDSMIQAFEEGKDVHRLTASLIFGKPPEEISAEDGSSSLGSGIHSERDWGKRANHGLNYDLGYRSFSMYYELPERESKFIVEKYHQVYPGVRQGFHAYVKRCLRENRTLTNPMGRHTLFLSKLDETTFKEAYACIPQGLVGDIVNEYGIEYIYYNPQLFSEVELLIQVHDSVGFQIPISVGWEKMANMLWLIKKSLETPMQIHQYNFSIPADLNIGLNMDKNRGKEFKAKNFPATPELLAKALKEAYPAMIEEENDLCQTA